MSTTGTPVLPPWMDKKMLEVWLRTHYGDVTVTDCEVKQATNKGDNYLSDMHRLVVTTKSGDTHRLVIKCCMEEGEAASIMRETSIYRREQEMYANTLPKMSALLQKAMPGNFEPIFPKCIYACKTFVVLEDLSAAGFKMGERRKGLDLDHCLLVMRTLARFHAASVVLHEQDPDSMKEYAISFFCDLGVNEHWSGFFSGICQTLAEELDTWPEEWRSYANKLRDCADILLELVVQTVQRRESGFNVLIHGDLWVNNILLRGHANEARFVDFQMVHFTTPVLDLHYFIVTSATIDVLMNHRKRLLEEYHTVLCDTLTVLGYTQTPISLKELHEEFDMKAMYTLYSMTGPYAVMQSEPDCGFNLDDALTRGVNPGRCMYGENYKKAVKYLLPWLKHKGVFDNKN